MQRVVVTVQIRYLTDVQAAQRDLQPLRAQTSLGEIVVRVCREVTDVLHSPQVFCSTRKAVQHTMAVLIKDITFRLSPEQQEIVRQSVARMKDAKIRGKYLIPLRYQGKMLQKCVWTRNEYLKVYNGQNVIYLLLAR